MANNNLEDLLPDFDDMNTVAVASSTARLQAHMVKDEMDAYIAECVRQAYQNKEFWVNGKPPVQTYIDRVVSVVGNTPEDAKHIHDLTVQLAELQKLIDENRALLLNMRDQVSVFQTLSSNKRVGIT
jgi:hypothetical protein